MTPLHPLANSIQHPSPHRHNPHPAIVLAGLSLAPVSWSLQLLVSYILSGDRCHDVGTLATTGTTDPALVATLGVLAVAGCVIGFWAAWRTWRETRLEAPGDHHEGLTTGRGRTRFLGLAGIVASLIFLVGSVFEALVPMLESTCGSVLP